MIDMPPGWTPQPNPSVDPQLKTDLADIKEHPPTQQEYMPRIVEQLKTCYDPEISVDIYNLGLKKIDKTGTTLNLLNNLATIYYKQEKFSLSETAFKKAVEIKPEHWSSRNGLAVLYAATKRPGLAEIEFKAMLRMRPGYPEALFNYGTMLAADSSRFVDAKKLFQQVLKASPGHSGATSNLKYVEYKMNENS